MAMNIHTVEADAELQARAEKERLEYPDGNVRPFVIELAARGRPVQASEWAVAMNTYERELLLPHVETEVFVQQTEHCLQNCERREGPSYDAALLNRYTPNALVRIRQLQHELATSGARWSRVVGMQRQLDAKLHMIRCETDRLASLVSLLLSMCREPTADRPPPFAKDTYAAGARDVKKHVIATILGGLCTGPEGEELLGGKRDVDASLVLGEGLEVEHG